MTDAQFEEKCWSILARAQDRHTMEQVVESLDKVAESYEENHDFLILPESWVKDLKQQIEEG